MVLRIVALIVLIVINGIFSATEIAYLSLNKFNLNKEIKKGNKKAIKILNLMNDQNTFLSAIQIAITLSGFLASAFAAESFAGEFAQVINVSIISYEVLTTILVVIITCILSYFTLVFGELIPKRLGMIYCERIAYSTINLLNVIITIFKPFIILLRASVNLFICIFKVKDTEKESEDTIKDSIYNSELEQFEKSLLFNVFEFNDTKVFDIMTKKEDVKVVDIKFGKEDISKILKEYKYTRFPIVDNEKVIGMLNIKDLIIQNQKKFKVNTFVRELIKIDKDMIIDDAFLLLTSKHQAMAQVVDNNEFIGIVTLEDIVEEIIGNIMDEYN